MAKSGRKTFVWPVTGLSIGQLQEETKRHPLDLPRSTCIGRVERTLETDAHAIAFLVWTQKSYYDAHVVK